MPDPNTTPSVTPSPEVPPLPETPSTSPEIESSEPSIEQRPESVPETATEQITETTQPSPVATVPDTQSQAQVSDESEVKNIETVLSQGMENAFLTMDAATQAVFKRKGEETSRKLAVLMRQTGVKIKQVISIIFDWLKIIPRVNKLYIEQEAKIKAEAILKMYKK